MPLTHSVVLVVIARNEVARFGRLRRSVHPSSTRCMRSTPARATPRPAPAAACGATISHLPRPGDLAAARNVTLERASANRHPEVA